MVKNNCLILDNEFLTYCKINAINDVDKLAKKIFERGFTIEKYGEIPFQVKGQEKIVEKEVVKEVVVEKIVEVVKETPTEKNVDVCSEILKENEKLKLELQKLTDALEGINKGTYLKSSNLNNLYSE